MHLHSILDLYGFNEPQQEGLLEALDLVQCKINERDSVEETLNVLNTALQTKFLRPLGSERQQLVDKFQDEVLRAQLLPLLSPFVEPINTGNNVPIKMLLGASEEVTRERFNALVDLEKNGRHTDIVYLLGGKRCLWIDHEPIASQLVSERLALAKNISKEDAKLEVKKSIAEFFPDQTNIGAKRLSIVKHFTNKGIIWPTESDMLERLSITYDGLPITKFILIDTPSKLDDRGQVVRPDTLDTFVELWKDHGENISFMAKDKPGEKLSMAMISSQPYGIYQQQQAIAVFHDKPVNIFVIANVIGNPADINISAIFDTLARIIYAGKDLVLRKLTQNICW